MNFLQDLGNIGQGVEHFLGVNQKPQPSTPIAPVRTTAPQAASTSQPVRTTAPGQIQQRFTPVQAPQQIGTTGQGQAVISKAGLKATPGALGGALLGAVKAGYDIASGVPKAAAAGYDAAGNKITHQRGSSRVSKALEAPDTKLNQVTRKLSPTAQQAASAGNISANALSVLGGGESAAGTEGSRVLDAAAVTRNTSKSAAGKAVAAAKNFDKTVTPLNQAGSVGKNAAGKPMDSAGDIAKQRVNQLKQNATKQPGTRAKIPAQPAQPQSISAPKKGTVGNPLRSPNPVRPSRVSDQNLPLPKSNIKVPNGQEDYVPNAVAPPGQKLSRFANKTVQNSDQVDLATKRLVDEKAVSYTPQATKAGQDVADKLYGSKNLKQSAIEVGNVLHNSDAGKITRQDVFNAHKVAERLQNSGNIEDKATAAEIYANLSAHHTAAGQQIQAAAALAKQSPEGMLYNATKSLQKAGVKVEGDVLDKVSGAIGEYKKALSDAGIKMDKNEGVSTDNLSRKQSDAQVLAYQKFVDTVNRQVPRNKWNAFIDIWRAGLLTGPETAAKVAVSHAITAPLELATKPVSAGIDRAVSLITHKRGYTFSPADLKAGAQGYKRGVQAANLKLRTDLDLPGTGGFEKKLATSKAESGRQTLYEKIPTRLHASLAKPNFTAEHEMSLRSQAYAEAFNKGLKGTERDQYIKDLVAKPTKQMLETAQKEAEHFTNQQKTLLGGAAGGIQKGLPGKLGTFLAPFTRIPGAIGTKGLIDWTPLGLGKGVMKVVDGIRHGNFDQRGFSQDLGRSLTGTGVAAIGYELMANGRMTLAAPKDPKEKALWQQEGKQKNSIYVGGTVTKDKNGLYTYKGGKWLTLNAFGPMGITMGLGAGYRDALAQGKSGGAAITQAASTGAKVLADQPYLKGISGVANAINDPAQFGQTFYDSTAGSFVPALSSQTARGTDTKQRAYVPGVPATVKGEIPGLRESLPVERNTFGQPVPSGNGGSLIRDINGTVNPFYPASAQNQGNPVTKELQRLYTTNGSQNAPAFAAPQKNLTINGQKMKLTPQQMDRYVAASGPLIQNGVANLLKNPDYSKLTDAQKTSQINDIITGARTAAKVSVLGAQPKTLSSSERIAVTNPTQLGKDVQLPGLHLATAIDPASKAELNKVYSMTSTAKTAYLNDPKNKYQYDLATYKNDVLNGKYDSVQLQTKQQAMAKEAVTSNYSNEINELYGMSKANITKYMDSHPNDAAKLEGQLVAMDNQLYSQGLVSSLKFKSGVTSSGSGGSGSKSATPVKAPTNTTDALSKLQSILKGTMAVHKPATPKASKVVSYKATPMKVGSNSGKSSLQIKSASVSHPKAPKTEKAPKYLKPSGASVSSKRVKLSV